MDPTVAAKHLDLWNQIRGHVSNTVPKFDPENYLKLKEALRVAYDEAVGFSAALGAKKPPVRGTRKPLLGINPNEPRGYKNEGIFKNYDGETLTGDAWELNSEWLDRIAQFNFHFMRFLDWQQVRFCGTSTYGPGMNPENFYVPSERFIEHEYFRGQVPHTVISAVCERLQCSPYIHILHGTTAEWQEGLGSYWGEWSRRTKLPVYFEYSNEIWNEAMPHVKWLHAMHGGRRGFREKMPGIIDSAFARVNEGFRMSGVPFMACAMGHPGDPSWLRRILAHSGTVWNYVGCPAYARVRYENTESPSVSNILADTQMAIGRVRQNIQAHHEIRRELAPDAEFLCYEIGSQSAIAGKERGTGQPVTWGLTATDAYVDEVMSDITASLLQMLQNEGVAMAGWYGTFHEVDPVNGSFALGGPDGELWPTGEAVKEWSNAVE